MGQRGESRGTMRSDNMWRARTDRRTFNQAAASILTMMACLKPESCWQSCNILTLAVWIDIRGLKGVPMPEA